MVAGMTRKLADFVAGARFSALPGDIVHESKRILLDSVGCAIGGLSTEMGSIAVKLARRLGGKEESTIIGTGARVSCTNAAFANGELINALDFDAGSVGHDTPVVIAGSLALSENAKASGKDLLLAIAVGHEIATRLGSAEGGLLTITKEGVVTFAEVCGYASTSIAAAASASKIMNHDAEKMANALGLAAYLCAPNVAREFLDLTPAKMAKYGILGWYAQAGVTASLLAGMEFTGDTEVLDGENGFWKYTGRPDSKVELVLPGLGEKWVHRISYKQYPANFPTAGAMDCFAEIVKEQNIQPDEIIKIVARVWPIMQYRYAGANRLGSAEDYTFNTQYGLTCLAHRIDPSKWLDPEVRNDPKLRKFMDRVEFDIGCDEEKFSQARLKNPEAVLMSAEVHARGQTFKKETLYRKGMPRPGYQNTDEELIEKFRKNVSRVLTAEKANRIVKAIFDLDSMKNVNELMRMLG